MGAIIAAFLFGFILGVVGIIVTACLLEDKDE